jgi:hypothetical protein
MDYVKKALAIRMPIAIAIAITMADKSNDRQI